MASDEAKYLLEPWDKHIRPFCGKRIPEGKPIGN